MAQVPVAVITAHGSMETAVEALKYGAFDFVSKPLDIVYLRKMVSTALKLRHNRETGSARGVTRLFGQSQAIEQVRVMVAKLARSQAPVHISGESGTGKELVARLIHENGPRADHAFVAVNCGAIPTELMESEFFGHKKGSFTGAVADKEGLFQAAQGGTLFLDEVARSAAAHAGETAARHPGKGCTPGRQRQGNRRRCAHPFGYTPLAGRAGAHREIP